MSILGQILDQIREFWKVGDRVARGKAVQTIESELEEMENIFGLLVLGSFVGMPSPPMQISLDLMPFMERELILMMEKVDTAREPISQLFSIFNID
ncbi:MAG: hypothetical protein JRI76_13205 [Deltaproteobacteria bacterium]|nr:hypothetical protein [Deltaproteobacteria bacterium]MBW2042964.1 hypothetical protein [Deltaproteobacteria bacterium]